MQLTAVQEKPHVDVREPSQCTHYLRHRDLISNVSGEDRNEIAGGGTGSAKMEAGVGKKS